MEIALLVLTAWCAVVETIALLPLFGFDLRFIWRPRVFIEQAGMLPRPPRVSWIALILVVVSWALSCGAFYYFFRPRIVEKIVEKPVDRIVEKVVKPDCPKSLPLSKSKPNANNTKAEPETVTNAPNGIAIGGGQVTNPIVNNYGPPEAKLTAHWKLGTLQEGGLLYTATITVNTDRSTAGPQLIITCDAPCSLKSMNLGIFALSGSDRTVDDHTVEVGVSQQFTPDQTFTVILSSKSPFNITAIRKK